MSVYFSTLSLDRDAKLPAAVWARTKDKRELDYCFKFPLSSSLFYIATSSYKTLVYRGNCFGRSKNCRPLFGKQLALDFLVICVRIILQTETVETVTELNP